MARSHVPGSYAIGQTAPGVVPTVPLRDACYMHYRLCTVLRGVLQAPLRARIRDACGATVCYSPPTPKPRVSLHQPLAGSHFCARDDRARACPSHLCCQGRNVVGRWSRSQPQKLIFDLAIVSQRVLCDGNKKRCDHFSTRTRLQHLGLCGLSQRVGRHGAARMAPKLTGAIPRRRHRGASTSSAAHPGELQSQTRPMRLVACAGATAWSSLVGAAGGAVAR